MTEQIFKAYDLDKKEWVEDFMIRPDGLIYKLIGVGQLSIKPINATLVRATGLRDLYEWDIVKLTSRNGVSEVGCIHREGCEFKINIGHTLSLTYCFWIFDIEKLGNIFDNPELLEVVK